MTATIESKLRTLVESANEADRLRAENATLRSELDGIGKIVGMNGHRPRPSKASKRSARKPENGKRHRTSDEVVARQYAAIVKAANGEWQTREAIVKKDGLTVSGSVAAWGRAIGNHPGVKAEIKSNGKRGNEARYLRA